VGEIRQEGAWHERRKRGKERLDLLFAPHQPLFSPRQNGRGRWRDTQNHLLVVERDQEGCIEGIAAELARRSDRDGWSKPH
jgi:hypothetical protein